MRLVRDDSMLDEDVHDELGGEGLVAREDRAAGEIVSAEPQDGPVEDVASVIDDDAEGDAADDAIETSALEAILFTTHHPLTAGRLAELLDLPATGPIRRAIKSLNRAYEETGRSFRVEQVAGGYQLLTLPEYGEHLRKFHQREADAKLSKAAMETLAIIAYKQPILRVDVEAIRGVACGETIRNLMEKRLVRIAGRAEEPGRPILYGTTKRFLELFGLNSLKDLPQAEEPGKAGPPGTTGLGMLPPEGEVPVTLAAADAAGEPPAAGISVPPVPPPAEGPADNNPLPGEV